MQLHGARCRASSARNLVERDIPACTLRLAVFRASAPLRSAGKSWRDTMRLECEQCQEVLERIRARFAFKAEI